MRRRGRARGPGRDGGGGGGAAGRVSGRVARRPPETGADLPAPMGNRRGAKVSNAVASIYHRNKETMAADDFHYFFLPTLHLPLLLMSANNTNRK